MTPVATPAAASRATARIVSRRVEHEAGRDRQRVRAALVRVARGLELGGGLTLVRDGGAQAAERGDGVEEAPGAVVTGAARPPRASAAIARQRRSSTA